MAQRRMLNPIVICSDAFLDMDPTAQNLYFHLNLNADDEGFVSNGQSVKEIVSAKDEDLNMLIKKGYLIEFKSKVMLIRHWHIHNRMRIDRQRPTLYSEEKNLVIESENRVYELKI